MHYIKSSYAAPKYVTFYFRMITEYSVSIKDNRCFWADAQLYTIPSVLRNNQLRSYCTTALTVIRPYILLLEH